MKVIVASGLVMLLAACSVTTEQLAKDGNWYEIGYQDGVSGHTQRSLSDLASLGSVKQSDYDEGYLIGVGEYCNPNFAYQIGLSGQYYEGVCEGTENAQRFRMEWKRGWEEHSNAYY